MLYRAAGTSGAPGYREPQGDRLQSHCWHPLRPSAVCSSHIARGWWRLEPGESLVVARHCTVSNVVTHDNHRRRGLARAMMKSLLHAGASQSCDATHPCGKRVRGDAQFLSHVSHWVQLSSQIAFPNTCCSMPLGSSTFRPLCLLLSLWSVGVRPSRWRANQPLHLGGGPASVRGPRIPGGTSQPLQHCQC